MKPYRIIQRLTDRGGGVTLCAEECLRMRTGWRSALSTSATIGTGILLVLFLMSSLFAGFEIQTPWGIIPCREPTNLLLLAVVAAVLAAAADPLPRNISVRDIPPADSRAVVAALTGGGLLLWLRTFYRAMDPGALRNSSRLPLPPTYVHWQCVFVFGAALAMWFRLRDRVGRWGAFFAASMTLAAGLWFPMSPLMTFGWASVMILSWAAPWLSQAMQRAWGSRRWEWLSIGAAVFVVIITRASWAGNRLMDQLWVRAIPGWPLVLLVIVGAARGRKFLFDAQNRALALAAVWGLVLGGGRAEVGYLGGLLALPLLYQWMALGVQGFVRHAALRNVLLKNLFVLALAGLLMGRVRLGLRQSVLARAAAPAVEAEAPTEVELE